MTMGAGALRAELRMPDSVPKKKKKSERIAVPESLVAAPQGVPVEVRVLPGERVTIPLKVYGRRGVQMEYRVRSAPETGRLVESRQVRPEAAELVYEAPTRVPGEEDLVEEMTFVARDRSGTSSPTTVKITIVNEPPEVALAEEVVFGEIAAGSATAREITLSNPGHRLAEGKLEISEPWTVTPARYRLRAGESATFRIGITPSQAREYVGYLRLPSMGKGSRLQALAVASVSAGPSRIDLVGDPDHLRRTGALTLANRTDQPRSVTIHAAKRLGLPGTVSLEPGETREVPLVIGEDDLGAVEETIRVVQGSYLQEVQVRALAVGPRLAITPEAIAFGQVRVGHEARGRLRIRNGGGAVAGVTASASPGFTVEPARFELEPGADREVEIRLEATTAGALEGKVNFQVAGSRVGASLSAEALWPEVEPGAARVPFIAVSPEKAAAASQGKGGAAHPGPAGRPAGPGSSVSAMQAVGLVNGMNPQGTPAIRTIEVRELAPTRIDLAWRPVAESTGYRVEARRISMKKSGGVEATWVPVAPVEMEPGAKEVRAAITGIPEGAAATIRVVAIGPEGKSLTPSPPLSFSLPRRPTLFTLQRVLLAGFILVFAVGLWLRAGRSVFGVRVAR